MLGGWGAKGTQAEQGLGSGQWGPELHRWRRKVYFVSALVLFLHLPRSPQGHAVFTRAGQRPAWPWGPRRAPRWYASLFREQPCELSGSCSLHLPANSLGDSMSEPGVWPLTSGNHLDRPERLNVASSLPSRAQGPPRWGCLASLWPQGRRETCAAGGAERCLHCCNRTSSIPSRCNVFYLIKTKRDNMKKYKGRP